MTTFYPPALGETAFSLLASATATTDDKAIHHAMAVAFRRCSPLLYTLPTRVGLFCNMTQNAYGPPSTVLSRHSLYQYFCSGMSAKLQARLYDQLLHMNVSRTCAPRLPPFFECGNRFGLECQECSALTWKQTGRRVSLCSICLPFLICCPIHHCSLTVFDACSMFESHSSVQKTNKPSRYSVQYAERALSLSKTPPHIDCREHLHNLLEIKGYMHDSGRIRLAALTQAFAKFFSSGFEDLRLTALLDQYDIANLVVRDLARWDRAIHPVFLTLLLWFLSETDDYSHANYATMNSLAGTTKRQIPKSSESKLLRAKRREWLAHIKISVGSSRTEMRLQSCGLWTWLYRNDREWLDHHQVAKRRPNGTKQHSKFPLYLRSILPTFRNEQTNTNTHPPARRSDYQTRLKLGMDDYSYFRCQAEFPKINKANHAPGAREVWLNERIAWAIQKIESDGLSICEGRVAAYARLRIETLRHHLLKANQTLN